MPVNVEIVLYRLQGKVENTFWGGGEISSQLKAQTRRDTYF